MTQSRPVPPAIPASARLALLAISVLVLLMMNMDTMWATSVDLAHHYALVVRLSDLWTLPHALDPSLGEMNVYPRLAHQTAAILGRLAGSPLLGLQIVTVLSLLLFWAAVAWIVQTLPRAAAIATALMLAALMMLNLSTLQMQVHGDEVAGNFFFSQLAAQGFVMAVIAACMTLDAAGHPSWLRNVLLAGAVWLATSIHLMPALELLCVMGVLVTLDLLQLWRQRRTGFPVAGVLAGALLLAALVLLATHPAFRAMSSISINNGAMFTNHLGSVKAVLNYSVLITALSGAIVWRWLVLERRENNRALLALKYVGSYGLAVSGLCLLQALAWKFGFGSEYAIKKYVAALNSVVLLELALLPVLFVRALRLPAAAGGNGVAAIVHAWLLPSALTAFAFHVAIAPAVKIIDISELASLEQQLILRRDLLIPAHPGRFTYVAGVQRLPPHLAYMMSIALFQTPRSANAASILTNRALIDWTMVGSIVTSEGSYMDKQDCRRAPPAQGIAVMDGRCLERRMGVQRTRIEFGGPQPGACTLQGFGDREQYSTWTIAMEASMSCPVPLIAGKAPSHIEIDAAAFLNKVASQRAIVSVNGAAPMTFVFDAAEPKKITVPLTGTVGEQVEIRLTLPDARSPQELGLSGDQRKLGLALRALEFK
ncbi:hypothetical protein [Massilia sp. TWR1-2-2]|uniref:hypothetical protein n=1 Tax=Massilia sp. TWR1-2-2 TaxID=2804584 RepID=UPI003CF62F71